MTATTIIFNVLSTIIIYIYEIKNQKEFCQIIKSLNEIDEGFKKLGVHMSYRKNKNIISFLVFLLYICVGTVSLLDFVAYKEAVLKINRLFLTLLYIIPLIIQCSMTWVICIYLRLLKQRFKIINEVVLEKVKLAYILRKEYIVYDHVPINT